MTARLTIISATRPATLSKSVTRATDGSVLKTGGGNLVEGRAKLREIAGLHAFAELLATLGPAEALTYGVPRRATTRVLSRRAWAAGNPPDAVTRTRDNFSWPLSPGIMMIDHDPDPEGRRLERDALIDLLRSAAPGLANAAMLW